MLIEQIIKFKLRKPGPLIVRALLKLVIFMTTQKSPWQIEKLFIAKILQEAMYLASSIWDKSLTKFNPENQDFKHV